jgi:enoyl-CoA hydratase/carnithine racemase
VNRVVPNDQLEAESERLAEKLAALPHGAVRLNKALVNRVYLLAAFHEALAYREDPEIAALLAKMEDDARVREQRRIMREQGWGAFREQRDALYRETSSGPEARPRP